MVRVSAGVRGLVALLAATLAALGFAAVAAAQESEGRMQMRAPLGQISSQAYASAGETPEGPGGSPFCEGDGVSGSRIQAVYGHVAGTPDAYAESLPTIRTMASAIDDAFNASAALGGGSAHPRWAMEPGTCKLSVLKLELPAGAPDDFELTVQALRDLGLLATNKLKFIVWTDAEGSDNLIAKAMFDTNPDPATNRADGGAQEATVAQLDRNGGWDTDGFGGPRIAWGPQHELAHMLGAVNQAAPHSDGSGHCTDEYDAMCFGPPDGPVTCGDPNVGSTFLQFKVLLDCNQDDYFAVAPPAGSYLANNWNTYNSSYLVRTDTPDLPPETAKIKGPRRTQSPRPTFQLGANEAGSTFQCKLDKATEFSPCGTRYKPKRLKPGRHTLQVQAIDATGNVDFSAATKKFKVLPPSRS